MSRPGETLEGVDYQRGTLHGFEVREYLLTKFGHRCVYCDAQGVPLNLDHVAPRARGGSDRVSNLVLSCVPCNQAKGAQDVRKFAPDRATLTLARAKRSLRDAAATQSIRNATLRALGGITPVECSTGGRTKWNRTQLGLPKGHTIDAAALGDVSAVHGWNGPVLVVRVTGRGSYRRGLPDRFGFPRTKPGPKQVHGFQTGDLVRAVVPPGMKTSGVHVGRVAIRSSGSFRVGKVDGINRKYCQTIQRSDGYEHNMRKAAALPQVAYPSPRINPGVSRRQDIR